MCLTYYEVCTCSHRECLGNFVCDETCTPITHIDYIDMKCADCEEAEVVEATAKAKANREAEDEKSALARSQKCKATEDEYWKKAIDDFLVYAKANGWVLDG
jgi:hypothetical protein